MEEKVKNLLKVFMVVVFLAAVQENVLAQDYEAKVKEMNKLFEKSLIANDYTMTIDYYADDAYSLPSYEPMLHGKEALKAAGEAMKNSPMNFKDFKLTSVKIIQSGELVIDIGTYSYEMEIPGMPDLFKDTGKYMNVYRIEGDKLSVIADTWNSDTNPWEMMGGMPEEK